MRDTRGRRRPCSTPSRPTPWGRAPIRTSPASPSATIRRWWARGEKAEGSSAEAEPKLKPTYIEELEARLAAKDGELQQILAKYRAASDEFDQARARLRKEISKDVERSRRSTLVSFLEVLDNLDRALASACDRADDPFVQGVSMVQQQFVGVEEAAEQAHRRPAATALDMRGAGPGQGRHQLEDRAGRSLLTVGQREGVAVGQ